MKKKKTTKKFSLATWKDYRIGLTEDNNPPDNLLSEKSGDDYRADIKPIDIDIIGEKAIMQDANQNYDSEASDFIILFNIEIEERQWGIKSIYVTARQAAGSVFLNLWTEGDDDVREIDCSDFELETDVEISSDVVTIHSLVVDVENRKIICS